MRNLYNNPDAASELMANAMRLFIDVDLSADLQRFGRCNDRYLNTLIHDFDRCPDYLENQTLNRSTFQDFRSLVYRCELQSEKAYHWNRRYTRRLDEARARLFQRMWNALVERRPYINGFYTPRRKGGSYELNETWELRKQFGKKLAGYHKILTNPEARDADLMTALSDLLTVPSWHMFYEAASKFLGKHAADVMTAHENCQRRFRISAWDRPVWDNEPWFCNSPLYPIHMAHTSTTDPGLIAYHQSVDKMKRDVQTPIKPGKYLQKFFSNVLSPEQIRLWSERQTLACAPLKLEFVQTNDPDGWEWVYENSPNSCMRYRRHSRYLDADLYGRNHPARVYASGKNDLALAYIMLPGKVMDRDHHSDYGEHVVAARTIVNVSDKTWLRIYADDDRYRTKLRDLLDANGYHHSDDVLNGQRLTLRYHGGSTICPYLDGDYVYVFESDDYLIVNSDDGVCAQNSSGLISLDDSACECTHCGRTRDADDMTYVNDEPVCDRCISEHYTYAVTRWGQEWISPDDAVLCRSNEEYYHIDCLDRYDIVEDIDGDHWFIDDVVTTRDGYVLTEDAVRLDFPDGEYDYAVPGDTYELPDGKVCHEDDKDDILAEHYPEDDEPETVEAEPVDFALAA